MEKENEVIFEEFLDWCPIDIKPLDECRKIAALQV
jgi:hypothetical protein